MGNMMSEVLSSKVQPIPAGFHTITPHLVVFDAKAALDFYQRAFGASVLGAMPSEDGKRIMHACLQIGDSKLMLCDEFREFGQTAPTTLGGSPVSIHLYVEDADAFFERAVLAGATIIMPVNDTFWGDRYGKVSDPFGHHWAIATCVREVSCEEMSKASKACSSANA
jgi:PhnB protein